MSNRLTRIYTRGGDKGKTGLADGSRVDKYHPRIEALGDVDELNSLLGCVLASREVDATTELLRRIQNDLFDLGGELAVNTPEYVVIVADTIDWLEQALESINESLPPLEEFILPGGKPDAAQLHLARTVCRRAERRLVELAAAETVNPQAVAYLNRLSDLLFVLARSLNRAQGEADILWQPRTPA